VRQGGLGHRGATSVGELVRYIARKAIDGKHADFVWNAIQHVWQFLCENRASHASSNAFRPADRQYKTMKMFATKSEIQD
jgi:hypothetical protein